MERCCMSLNIREMPTKSMRNTITYYNGLKNMDNISCWQSCGAPGTLIHCYWEYKMLQYGHSGKWFGSFLELKTHS